jgi:pyruvate/2-oxoglutarate dehydrogenase complex dihydrolipoamide dehydrogenase (E3) component
MSAEHCKNVIIGSGEGGKYLAWHLASSGEQTMVVERRWIGGSCPNVNCLPAKNEIWSAKVADLVHHASAFGITTGPVSIDLEGVRNRKREMVSALVAIHVKKYESTGTQLVMGQAKFIAPNTIEVALNDGGTRTITAERIFLNLGTTAVIPPVPGLRESNPLTHIEILELAHLPEHLVVIGGGYVGLEFAQAYRRFGSKVTILQRGPQLIADADPDIAEELQKLLVAEGIEILTNATIASVEGHSGDHVRITLQSPSGDKIIEASDILVATGRTPNTANIGLDIAGVETTAAGFLKVNDRLETTAANIWAIGECAGSPQFTHASMDDHRIIRDNLAGGHRSTVDRLMPSCLYTDPQVAHVGLSETEAKQKGIAYYLAKIPMGAVLRTRTISETSGFMKSLIDPVTGRILGFTAIGAEAGEVMSVVQLAMMASGTYITLRDGVLAHPTMSEGLNVLFATVKLPPQTPAK